MKTGQTVTVILLSGLLLGSCATGSRLSSEFTAEHPGPDYSLAENWASLPEKIDPADLTPTSQLTDNQNNAEVDVFFLHPTTHTRKKRKIIWNAPLQNEKINLATDEGTIQYQASIFNGAGRIYAPRYRQAHLQAYFTDNQVLAEKAFDLAYSDVKTAFEYYLNHYNQGRPIIIASHSQGTTHGLRLVKEYFDGKPLADRLVVAYLVGIPVSLNDFDNIPPCETPEQTGCFCSWRTYRTGYFPKTRSQKKDIIATNPLSWTLEEDTYAPNTLNQGAVLTNFNKVRPKLSDAQVHDGLVWITKPRFPWSFLIRSPNYHIGDFNLFYINVRNNAILRVESYLNR